MRLNNRFNDQIRNLNISHGFSKYAEGSVFIEFENTKVLCTASVIPGVPRFKKDSGQGWLTAEYAMLPRSTHMRIDRESMRGRQTGRSQEIQRLIGRALRSCVDFSMIGDNTIKIDCDVIQADGGTRTASITGGYLALVDAIEHMKKNGMLLNDLNPILYKVAAISAGIYQGDPLLDLDYNEDSNAETDMNVVMNSNMDIIEIQGTAEGRCFSETELKQMVDLARKGILDIFNATS